MRGFSILVSSHFSGSMARAVQDWRKSQHHIAASCDDCGARWEGCPLPRPLRARHEVRRHSLLCGFGLGASLRHLLGQVRDRPGRCLGFCVLVSLALASCYCFGAEALVAQRDAWLRPSSVGGLIGMRCWSIPQGTSLPQFCWWPVEEVCFLLLRATRGTWGLLLAMNVLSVGCGMKAALRRRRGLARTMEHP